jgi:lipopolysaccharide/colanic/teichoic acid biosynthesis glycosyltransferase
VSAGWYRSYGKRAFDVVVSSSLLITVLPLFLVVGALVWRNLGRPVYFRQERPGLDETPFTLVKFRTMTDARDSSGRVLADDQRLTRFGRVLRRTSLDELPELVNVIRGDMSLVGPRPLLMAYLPLYDDFQRRRHSVRPGITGWAQIRGRNAVDWESRFELDVYYVEHLSMWLDLKVLARTFAAVLSRAGVSQPGEATMKHFRGSLRE